jgi:glycyl-tRNA synthetase beta chain
MRKHDHLLVEIQTEELPPKSLQKLAASFLKEMTTRLSNAAFAFGETQFFATPRRLTVFIKKLSQYQPDTTIERKGPAVSAAFDKNGDPTPACLGFARSVGLEPSELIKLKTSQGEWVGCKQVITGKQIQDCLPAIVEQALTALPIPKRMRWGTGSVEFVRPVHSVIMLYGKQIVPAEILGCQTGRKTLGHRFHSKNSVSISSPTQYLKTLEKKYVIADFYQRKQSIRQQTAEVVKNTLGIHATALINDALLDEVTGLVEWPVALCGNFDKQFLTVPQEALISAMQDHQRYFPVVDQHDRLLPHFITISNIHSKDPEHVVSGNERVLRARLSDAAFFFETDKKQTLDNRLETLKGIVFQNKLGSLFDKAKRLSELAAFIAKEIKANVKEAKRAGLLAKTDLTTQLVSEFPELQGIAGFYYAQYQKEPVAVAKAINEHYLPRFSGDTLPITPVGCTLAIADRIDTLVGTFGINQIPSGDKDPLGLRRAAVGILRILIERQLDLDLIKILNFSASLYVNLENTNVVTQLFEFILERLKFWYLEQDIPADVFASVAALKPSSPYDLHCRIQAVAAFKKMPAAESLSVANKRVNNILTKYEETITLKKIDAGLFEHNAEKKLAEKLAAERDDIISLSNSARYADILMQLAELREPVDAFFEHVLVMTDDIPRRENRLLLLKDLRALFLHVADIALLQ